MIAAEIYLFWSACANASAGNRIRIMTTGIAPEAVGWIHDSYDRSMSIPLDRFLIN